MESFMCKINQELHLERRFFFLYEFPEKRVYQGIRTEGEFLAEIAGT